jgi:putative phosphoserine phosphatase/1-acylglycerol-3-phosphate O-acyltransferase
VSVLEATFDEIRSGPGGPRIGAFFDFDGTLIDGYSATTLYSHRLRNFEIGPDEAVRTVLAGLRGDASEEQFAELAARSVRGWTGRVEEDLVELGERLFVQGIAAALFHDAWRLVKAHQRRGHTVAISTSATRFQVEPLARELGVEHILCTQLEVEDGILTGRLSGRPPWAAGKVAAVEAFAAERSVDLADSHGYANGDEDVEFLKTVGRPHAVNPQKRLASVAADRGWPVLRFSRGGSRLDPLPAIRTAAMYGSLFGSAAAGIGLGLVNRNRRQGVDTATELFGDLAGVLGNITFEVIGEEHLWSHRPAVFLINHQSNLIDLLVFAKLVRRGFTAVAKKEVERMPVLGQVFRMADVAFVERGDPGKAVAALQPVVEKLRGGVSVVMAPEGTRSTTPQVGPFKKGAFHMAMQAGVPIVPVVVRNAGELMWRNAKTTQSGTLQIVVHAPVETKGWRREDLDEHVAVVRQLYVDTLEDWPGFVGPSSESDQAAGPRLPPSRPRRPRPATRKAKPARSTKARAS